MSMGPMLEQTWGSIEQAHTLFHCLMEEALEHLESVYREVSQSFQAVEEVEVQEVELPQLHHCGMASPRSWGLATRLHCNPLQDPTFQKA